MSELIHANGQVINSIAIVLLGIGMIFICVAAWWLDNAENRRAERERLADAELLRTTGERW